MAKDTVSAELLADLSDEALVGKVIAGDQPAAAYLLLERCGPGLKFLVQTKYRTLGLELGELVSELYILLRQNDWRALQAFRGASREGRACKLSHYVYCVASRWLWKKMDRKVKEKTWLLPLDEVEEVPAEGREPAQHMAGADVIAAIMALPDPTDRAVIILYKIEERDVGEVAELLKTTPGMAKYKAYDYSQLMMVPVCLSDQLQPGTLEHTIHYVITDRMDLSAFASEYNNDEIERTAYDPAILLKIVLLGYARGLNTSRRLERAWAGRTWFSWLWPVGSGPITAHWRHSSRG